MNVKLRRKTKAKKNHFNVITINGQVFVSGLEWVSLTSPIHFMAEARKLGKEKGMSIVAIRDGRNIETVLKDDTRHRAPIQAGYVPQSNEAAQRGMYSLSLAIAGALPEDTRNNFIGVFKLEDGSERYALAAVHRGEVVAMADVIESSAEITLSLLQKTINLYENSFSAVYCPPELGYAATASFALSDLLIPGKISEQARLKKLFFGLSNKELTYGGVIALAIAVGGWKLYSDYKFKQEVEAEIARAAAERAAALEDESKSSVNVAVLQKPWVERPSFGIELRRCAEIIYRAPLNLAGWSWGSASCSSSSAEWIYNRNPGATVKQLHEESGLKLDMYPAIQIPGDMATYGFELGKLKAEGDDVDFRVDEKLNEFISYFQLLQAEVTLTEVKPETQLDEMGNPLPGPSWIHYSFELKTQYEPTFIMADLDIRGIRFSGLSVSLQGDNLEWIINGDVYANR
ncbi:type 4b pilus protein PilO2 [Aeromonas caviae]|uniref:type 4b pilus protein PilO2 n=1 Tax=Aeromonas TaxID=642 RepID=UPI003D22197C